MNASLLGTTAYPQQASLLPSTRLMGSKEKLLPLIWLKLRALQFQSAIDLFAGSNSVAYLIKASGRSVITNDYMRMSATLARAIISNSYVTLSSSEVQMLKRKNKCGDNFVARTFGELYYSASDVEQIDTLLSNIRMLNAPQADIAKAALIRACVKKRARGVFTYTGIRYDDGRRDLALSIFDHFSLAVETLNKAVFSNNLTNESFCTDAMSFAKKGIVADLVYIDPPYFSKLSDNDYIRRYHFIEGIARNWEGVEIQSHTKTLKFATYPTPFSTLEGSRSAFLELFKSFSASKLIVSYSSNSLPSKTELISLLKEHKRHVEVVPIRHRYSFGTQNQRRHDNNNSVEEYLFITE